LRRARRALLASCLKKRRLAARLGVGNVALPNVRYWVNSGRHLLNSSSSVFDPSRTWSEFEFRETRPVQGGLSSKVPRFMRQVRRRTLSSGIRSFERPETDLPGPQERPLTPLRVGVAIVIPHIALVP
jgi:hypothetical protein